MIVYAVDEFYEKKKEAKECYSKIGRIWCPVLNDYIIFNQLGFRHLIRKGRKPRSKNDQIRRFALLPFVENTIQSTSAKITHKGGKAIQNVSFLVIMERQENQIITVVIQQNKAGRNYFLSIYNQKIA